MTNPMTNDDLSAIHARCAEVLGLGRFPKPGELSEAVNKLLARVQAGRDEVARLNAILDNQREIEAGRD